jgi:DNA-binding response OmpR family regulator
MADSILEGKRVLAVDDEPDVLDTLEEMLEEFEGLTFDRATDYETGYQLLRSWSYDLVILDIMGVRGFDLLNAAVHLGVPAVMLTAHAVSVDALKKSIELGARAYIPKDRIADLVPFLEDVLRLKRGAVWQNVFQRLGGFFDSAFGPQWQKNEKSFWEQVSQGAYEPEPVILKGKRHHPKSQP